MYQRSCHRLGLADTVRRCWIQCLDSSCHGGIWAQCLNQKERFGSMAYQRYMHRLIPTICLQNISMFMLRTGLRIGFAHAICGCLRIRHLDQRSATCQFRSSNPIFGSILTNEEISPKYETPPGVPYSQTQQSETPKTFGSTDTIRFELRGPALSSRCHGCHRLRL